MSLIVLIVAYIKKRFVMSFEYVIECDHNELNRSRTKIPWFILIICLCFLFSGVHVCVCVSNLLITILDEHNTNSLYIIWTDSFVPIWFLFILECRILILFIWINLVPIMLECCSPIHYKYTIEPISKDTNIMSSNGNNNRMHRFVLVTMACVFHVYNTTTTTINNI